MSNGDSFLSRLALRLSLLVGGIVLAATLAAASAGGGAGPASVPGMLAALLAAAVAGWTVHAALASHVIQPLRRLAAWVQPGATDELATLESALEASQQRSERLAELEAQTASLRHDVRNMLSPALLSADRLTGHDDPTVAKAATVIVRAVDRTAERLAATRAAPPQAAGARCSRSEANNSI